MNLTPLNGANTRISKARFFGSLLTGIGAGIGAAIVAHAPHTISGYAPYIVGAALTAIGNFCINPLKADASTTTPTPEAAQTKDNT